VIHDSPASLQGEPGFSTHVQPPEIPRTGTPSSPLDESEFPDPDDDTAFLGPADPNRTLTDVWRHSGWARTRARVYAALIRTNQPVHRTFAFADCGSRAYVVRNVDDNDRYKIVGSGCRDRFCQPCQRDRSRVIVGNVLAHLEHQPVRMLTLTRAHNDLPLESQIHALYLAFVSLRRTPYWKRHVTGGLAVLEVKLGDDGRWHPHYHCLLQGKYLPHAHIRRLWHEITGDSFIVHIKMAHDDGAVLRYITKYITKSFTGPISRNPTYLDELVRAMYNVRTIITWGTWIGVQATKTETDGEWLYFCTLEELVSRAESEAGSWTTILDSLCAGSSADLIDLYRSDRAARDPPFPRREPPDRDQSWLFRLW
jgi:hypothetical protein